MRFKSHGELRRFNYLQREKQQEVTPKAAQKFLLTGELAPPPKGISLPRWKAMIKHAINQNNDEG